MKTSVSVVAISGAASGIGRALALHYARRGVALSLSDVNDPEGVVRECRRSGAADVLGCIVDVRKRDEVSDWADRTFAHFGRVNVVINNAGVNLSGCFEQMQRSDFQWQMDINFWGVVNGCEAFLPHLKAAEWGHIVNVSSLFGLISMPNQSAYNASKFAVKGFTESLALEMAQSRYNIKVSTVHPGGIRTNIVNSARFGSPQTGALDIAQAKATFNSKLARTSAEKAASIIARGIDAGKKRILVGVDARLLDYMQRIFPAFYQNLVLRYVP